jgi:hypothetical protein
VVSHLPNCLPGPSLPLLLYHLHTITQIRFLKTFAKLNIPLQAFVVSLKVEMVGL